jgi:predicted porin
MKIFSVAVVMFLVLVGAARAADGSSTDNMMVTKAPPPAAKSSSSTPASCTNLWDFVSTDCPLSWYGITVYGTVDLGVTWLSHGTPYSPTSAVTAEYLVQKASNRSLWTQAANGLQNSGIGVKGDEQFAPGWSFIFDLEAGFDPYSFQLSNGPYSVTQNSGVPLNSQNAGSDSSRAGQFYNAVGYAGVSSPTYGTLTVFRQNALTLDGVFAYDPLGASYAFSPLGWQGITCGFGDTETCRFTTSVKYRVDIGPFRAAALWQFGGYDQNNPSNGAYQFQIGGDISHLANGVLSLDAIYSHSRDAVEVALAGNPGPPLPFETLTATISDNTSVMLLSRYTNGPLKLYAGYEWIQYAPPSDNIFSFTDIAGTFLCAGCAAVNNTNIVNNAFSGSAGFRDKIFQVVWTGAKYAVTDTLDLTVAYYFNAQNSYVVTGPNAGCSSAIAPQCSGTFNAVSFVADWKFAKKFDAYAGIMYSEVNNGLASGFLKTNNIDPTVGLRFRF